MSDPVLFRIDFGVTKDKAAGDRAQVPAVGTRVDFYGQGATVAATVTVPVSTPTSVSTIQVISKPGARYKLGVADPR